MASADSQDNLVQFSCIRNQNCCRSMYLFWILVFALLIYFFVDPAAAAGAQSPADIVRDSIAINCGSVGSSLALDGREWIGDSGYKVSPISLPKGKSISSRVIFRSVSVDFVPYHTARISSSSFSYTFQVKPGQKIIRLHFHSALYRGFKKSKDFFTVKAGGFTLLSNFSASLTADSLGVKYFWKEYCLDVHDKQSLSITFIPSSGRTIKESSYAFVNGIEIILLPTGLYHTHDQDPGAQVVGQKYRIYIDNSIALETMQRLNMGGSIISATEDSGMFRRWNEDTSFLLKSGISPVIYATSVIKHANGPMLSTPIKVYQTSMSAASSSNEQTVKLTWELSVDVGFPYLVRLHFCENDAGVSEIGQRQFDILMNSQMAEENADIIKWSGGNRIPVYRDYVVMMKGEKEGKRKLLISLQPKGVLMHGILNGLEIFKLSNPDNSLASPNPAPPLQGSRSWNQKILYLATGGCSVSLSSMLILFIFLDILAYVSRKAWEQKVASKKRTQSAGHAQLCRCFPLSKLKSATENFSEALVIGRGGYGKVYKGIIDGAETVAIKRLSPMSRQGPKEFWTEIEMLSKLRHDNLVSLLGYCNESEEMILVYEYMPRGNLAHHLYKKQFGSYNPLPWQELLQICIGAARGIDYLHTGSDHRVIHRDVKASNILLAENFEAKISDFGLSKLANTSRSSSFVSTGVKGTVGYLDPKYCLTHKLTRKADVFAFGVVLLEVLCGRPAVDLTLDDYQYSLALWALDCIRKGKVDEIIAPTHRGKIPRNCLKVFVEGVQLCLDDEPKKRPTMGQVATSLEFALQQYNKAKASTQEKEPEPGSMPNNGTKELDLISGLALSPISEQNHGSQSQPKHENKVSQDPAMSRVAEATLQSKKTDFASELADGKKPSRGTRRDSSRSKRKTVKERDIVFPSIPSNYKEILLQNRPSLRNGPVSPEMPQKESNLKFPEPEKQPIQEHELLQHKPCPVLSIKEIQAATDNFSDDNLVSIDFEFSKVYQGFLKGNRVRVVINSLEVSCTEIEKVFQLRHTNLQSLLGYCSHEGQTIIVYEHTPNGTLHEYLYGTELSHLSWKQTLKICIGAAKGLIYLIDVGGNVPLEFDIKPTNIFLDQNWEAKLSSIWLPKKGSDSKSKSLMTEKPLKSPSTPLYQKSRKKSPIRKAASPAMQTEILHYYGNTSEETTKESHVYLFGILLVEVLCGRPSYKRLDGRHIANIARAGIKLMNYDQLLSPHLEGKIDSKSLTEFLTLSLSCLQDPETHSPSLAEVLSRLELALKLQEISESDEKKDMKGEIADNINPKIPMLAAKFSSNGKRYYIRDSLVFHRDDNESGHAQISSKQSYGNPILTI